MGSALSVSARTRTHLVATAVSSTLEEVRATWFLTSEGNIEQAAYHDMALCYELQTMHQRRVAYNR